MQSTRFRFTIQKPVEGYSQILGSVKCKYIVYRKKNDGSIIGVLILGYRVSGMKFAFMDTVFERITGSSAAAVKGIKLLPSVERGICPKGPGSGRIWIDMTQYHKLPYWCVECHTKQKLGVKCIKCGNDQLWCIQCGPGSYHNWNMCSDNPKNYNKN